MKSSPLFLWDHLSRSRGVRESHFPMEDDQRVTAHDRVRENLEHPAIAVWCLAPKKWNL